MPSFDIEKVDHGAVRILRIHGRLDQGTVYNFQSEVQKEIDLGNVKIIINFHGCDYISSFAIGVCIKALRAVRSAGGDVKFCSLTKPIELVLSTLEMQKTFEVFETEEAAVASFVK